MELTLGEEKPITTWRAAVLQVSELAQARLQPERHGALQRATALVLAGHVWMDEDGRHAQVLSSDGTTWYVCNGQCTCMGATRAPAGPCKHRLAVQIYRRAGEQLTAAAARVQPAAADTTTLPAAPPSLTVPLVIDGRTCQLTLQDSDEARLLTRLAALLARYPQATCGGKGKGEQASAPAPTGETPTCPYHGAMKESTKVKGTWFCSSRMGDGSYCKEKWPKK